MNLICSEAAAHPTTTGQREKFSPKSCNFLLPGSSAMLPAPGKGRNFLQNPAIFSFLQQRHAPGAGQREKSSPKSCNLLFPAAAPRSRRRAKGEIFSKILQSSLSSRSATLPAPPKEKICAEALKILLLNLPSPATALQKGEVLSRNLESSRSGRRCQKTI